MIMLVALVSGIVTHRRLFVDFFTFRRRADQRGWLDAHNVTGVLALPFHVMITYTGLVTLASLYMPWGVKTAYRGDAQRYYVESGQITAPRPPAGTAGTLAPVGPMVVQALSRVPQPLERLTIVNPRMRIPWWWPCSRSPTACRTSIRRSPSTGPAARSPRSARATSAPRPGPSPRWSACTRRISPARRCGCCSSSRASSAARWSRRVWCCGRWRDCRRGPPLRGCRGPTGSSTPQRRHRGRAAVRGGVLLPGEPAPARRDAGARGGRDPGVLRRGGWGGSPRPGPRPRRAWIVALATVAVAYLLVPLVGGLREGGTVSVAFDVIVLGIGAGFGFAVHALAKRRFDPGRARANRDPRRGRRDARVEMRFREDCAFVKRHRRLCLSSR